MAVLSSSVSALSRPRFRSTSASRTAPPGAASPPLDPREPAVSRPAPLPSPARRSRRPAPFPGGQHLERRRIQAPLPVADPRPGSSQPLRQIASRPSLLRSKPYDPEAKLGEQIVPRVFFIQDFQGFDTQINTFR